MPDPPQGSPFARYFNLVESLQSARVAGTETIDIAGTPHDCWVVQCDLGTPQALAGDSSAQATATFWIDRARLLVLHDSTAVTTQNAATGARVGMDQVTTFRVGQVNEPLPDSLFVFAVPEGASQVESFQMPGQEKAAAGLVGRQAPAFALNDVSGRRVSLAGLKGRVVVLDFWATWCGPCQIIAPVLDQLAKDYAGKMRVTKLDVDANPRISARFNIRSIPALLFFKDGKHIDTVIGAVPKPTIETKIQHHLAA